MNESEKRREELLRSTRNLYQNREIPAVHPRYRAAYANLYKENDNQKSGSTLGIRILICLVLFAVFAAAESQGETLWKYTPSQIVTEIQRQPELLSFSKIQSIM